MTTTTSTHITSLRRAGLLVALLAACLGAIGAANAQASTVTTEGGALVLRAAPGEANYVGIYMHDDQPGKLAVQDTGTVQTATPEAPTEPMPQVPPPVAPEGETARQVLDRRYAAGELDRDEYLARRDDLD